MKLEVAVAVAGASRLQWALAVSGVSRDFGFHHANNDLRPGQKDWGRPAFRDRWASVTVSVCVCVLFEAVWAYLNGCSSNNAQCLVSAGWRQGMLPPGVCRARYRQPTVFACNPQLARDVPEPTTFKDCQKSHT